VSFPLWIAKNSDANFGEILSPFLNSITLWPLYCSMMLENVTARCTSGLLGRYLLHSFGIPSVPQTFLHLKGFINFCKSNCVIILGVVVVHSFDQSVNSRLHTPFVVFVDQVMRSELAF
jgi:hypothetical protein